MAGGGELVGPESELELSQEPEQGINSCPTSAIIKIFLN